jgi:HSP20 family protein
VELPGVVKEDITLEANEMYLRIAANVKRPTEVPEEDVLVSERTLGLIEREVELPIPVVPQGSKAALENGILTITLKKSPAVIMREIKLK